MRRRAGASKNSSIDTSAQGAEATALRVEKTDAVSCLTPYEANRQRAAQQRLRSRAGQSAERKMRVPEDVFEDFKGRRKGILRALTTE